MQLPPQYAFEDFAIRQVAQLLGKTDDEALFANRSLVWANSLCSPLGLTLLFSELSKCLVYLFWKLYRLREIEFLLRDPTVVSDGFKGITIPGIVASILTRSGLP